jgi:predicted HicB family RNase H-like nuclease
MSEMTPAEEYAFYERADNQEPQGPPRRRLGTPIPVRFPDDMLAEIRRRAAADDRSVASWIRKAVERELGRPA